MQFLRKIKAGESAYYEPTPEGTISVTFDSAKWFYKKEHQLPALKKQILWSFEQDYKVPMYIVGTFPDYAIEEK